MNKAQRIRYFKDLWPAACAEQGWDPKDELRRRDTTQYVLTLGGDTTGRNSTTDMEEFEITGLFLYLAHLGDLGSIDKLLEWEKWKADPRAYNNVRQARYWEKRAGYTEKDADRLERDRFHGAAPNTVLDAPMPRRESEQLLMTARERARKKIREQAAEASGVPLSNQPF